MARRKQSKPARRGNAPDKQSEPVADDQSKELSGGSPDVPPSDASGFSQVTTASIPGAVVVWLLSGAIAVHFFALFLSYSAIIEPSQTHSQLLDASTPYLRSTHFAADGRPFYLAHDTPDEQPHRLQYASRGKSDSLVLDSQTRWTNVEPSGTPGLASWDRYGRWMTLASTLAQSDRPSLAAALLMPLVAADESIDAIRIVRLPTQLTTAEQDAAPPVYLARVVRTSDDIRLVSIGSKRLSTNQRLPANETQDHQAGQQ